MCNVPDSILAILQKDIAEIKVALLGNEYNPEGGLLYRTTCLEREINKLKNKYDRAYYWVIGVSFTLAVIFNIVMQVLDNIVK